MLRTYLVTLAIMTVLGAAVPAVALPPLSLGPLVRVDAEEGAGVLVFDPRVAVLASGDYAVAWSRQAGAALPVEVHGRVFHAGGAAATPEVRLVQTNGSQRVDALAAAADGTFWLLYEQVKAGRGALFARHFRPDATPLGAPFEVNEPSPFNRSGGHLAIAADGRLGMAWAADVPAPGGGGLTGAEAHGRLFSASGRPITPELTLAAPCFCADEPRLEPTSVAFGGGGSLLVVWLDEESETVTLRLTQVTFAGTVAQATLVSGAGWPESGGSLAVAVDGAFTVAVDRDVNFDDQDTIAAVRFDAGGTALGGELQVNRGGLAIQPHAAPLPAGGVLVAWTDPSTGAQAGVARAFDGAGRSISRDTHYAANPGGTLLVADLAAGRGGDTVVVWEAAQPSGIFARQVGPP